jgi:hypothetical protein
MGNTQVKPMRLHYSLFFSTVGCLRLQKNEFERPQINLCLSICTCPVIVSSTLKVPQLPPGSEIPEQDRPDRLDREQEEMKNGTFGMAALS